MQEEASRGAYLSTSNSNAVARRWQGQGQGQGQGGSTAGGMSEVSIEQLKGVVNTDCDPMEEVIDLESEKRE